MKLQQAYISGHERKQYFAYGIKLYPLTLGHIQLLAEMDSSIPWGGAGIKHEDLAMILAVCCFPTWEQAREHIEANPSHVTDVALKIAQSISDDESQIVIEYIMYYLAKPASRGNSNLDESRIPWWWSYCEFLQTELHKDEISAWGTICSDAFAYFASFATRNGSEKYLTIREAYLEDQIKGGKTMAQLFEEGVI